MSQEQERDVIVVGAGPAGSTTATILAQQGHDVLLLDRSEFPRDKACGDGIPAGAFKRLYRCGMGDKFEEAKARGEMYPITGMRLMSPKGHVIKANFPEDDLFSHVMPRVYFDAVIQECAVESGADFRAAAVKGPLIEDGRVVGVSARMNGSVKPIRSKVVVGADGVTSVLTRRLRPTSKQHKDNHRAIAIRAYIHDLEVFPSHVEFFLYDEVLPGYGWIFPTADDEEANIGLGMRLDMFRKIHGDLNVFLQRFLDLPMIKKRLKRGGEVSNARAWQLNFGSQKDLRHTFDGALLVGDAAGFINPITGGGIHNAIISAEFAAETIDGALASGDVSREQLKVYEQRTHSVMWKSMRRSYLFQRLLIHFPSLVDLLVARAKENHAIVQTFLDKL
jgi:geranylgeranyl reductase family protein